MKVARAVTVPAASEFIMTGSCSVKPNDDEQTFLFEASENARQHLLVARSIVNPKTGKVPVKVINQRPSPLKLKKGFLLGTLQIVGSIAHTNDQYDITKQKEGLSVCMLKSPDSQHRRKPTSTENNANSRNSLIIDDTDFSCVTNLNDIQLPEMPKHLKDLFSESSPNLVHKEKIKLANLLIKYQDSFAKSRTEYGKCSVLKHRIDTAEAAPVRQPLRRTPQAFEKEEEKYIQEQLEAGVIQPSSSAWSSPIVMVRKKTGDVRVCIDYRKLNERTIKDAYPLPRIDMCLDCLSSAKIFSTIDLQSAYMQLEVDEEDRHKTAFITK